MRQRTSAAVLQQQPHVLAVGAHPVIMKTHNVGMGRQLLHGFHLLHDALKAQLPEVNLFPGEVFVVFDALNVPDDAEGAGAQLAHLLKLALAGIHADAWLNKQRNLNNDWLN